MKSKILLLFLTLLIINSFTVSSVLDTTNNSIYWSFDNAHLNGSNPIDLTGNGWTGSTIGPTTGVTGIINQSFRFDGINDEVIIADQFSTATSGTFSVWINYTTGANWDTIFASSDEAVDNSYFRFGIDTANKFFIQHLASGSQDRVSSTNTIPNQVLTHLVGTSDGSTYKIYIDSVEETLVIDVGANTGDWFGDLANRDTTRAGSLKRSGAIPIHWFHGDIDELTVWDNRELDQDEINQLFNAGAGNQIPYITEDLSIDNQTYNMTSDGGCTVWRNNTSTNCNTTDGTPTLTFTTNRAANCSIRASTSSGESFPSFNSNFSFSTTGGTTHIGTVYFADRLAFGQNYLYASCTDGGNATSGALAINMTAGEGGAGLIDCIKVLGTGCSVAITDSCAAILPT